MNISCLTLKFHNCDYPHAPVDDPKGINSALVLLLRSVTPFYTECPDKTSDSFRVSSMTLKDIPLFVPLY